MRLERYLVRRPARFSAPGDLHPDLLAWAERFLAGDPGNLVITGSTGVGKSWSAWRLGEEILRRGYAGRVEVTRAYQFKRLATPPADFGEIDRLTSAGLLALDDIGAVRVSDWDADHLYGAIDDRSEAMRPTIITTNAMAKREEGRTLLQTLLGDRVASRIAQDATIVILDGSDRRRSS
jgi:DNA replication protein DnaC